MQNVNKWDRKYARNTFSVIMIIVICLSFALEITISIHVDQHYQQWWVYNVTNEENPLRSSPSKERTDVN